MGAARQEFKGFRTTKILGDRVDRVYRQMCSTETHKNTSPSSTKNKTKQKPYHLFKQEDKRSKGGPRLHKGGDWNVQIHPGDHVPVLINI